ncbi:MAG: hypothetical protein P8P74_10515 [Crocinitomicaceae bacterium]|nr:hypothetical protein [Crocinitomicaceae bacterium]
MKENRLLKVLLLAVSLILGGLIIAYYWQVELHAEMLQVPMYVMIFALGYILTQIARRFLFSGKKWWDWFYYIALTSMIIPIFFSTPERQLMFNYLTDYGTFFFVIPTILDGRELFLKND